MKIEDQKKMHELYAHYWMAMATTGASKSLDIRKGTSNGEPLTDEEKN